MTDKPDGDVIKTESVLTYRCRQDYFEIREVSGTLPVQQVHRDQVATRSHHTIELNDEAWAWMRQVLTKVDGGETTNSDVQASTNIKTYLQVLGGAGKPKCHMDEQQLRRAFTDIIHGPMKFSFPVVPPKHFYCKRTTPDDEPAVPEPGSLADVEYYDPFLKARHDAAEHKQHRRRRKDIMACCVLVLATVGLLNWLGTGRGMLYVCASVVWSSLLTLFEERLQRLSVRLFGKDLVRHVTMFLASVLCCAAALTYVGNSVVGVVVCVTLALVMSIRWAVRPLHVWWTSGALERPNTMDWAVIMRRKGVVRFTGPTWNKVRDRYEVRDCDSPRAWSITCMQCYRLMRRRFRSTRAIAKALKPLKEDTT